MQRNPHSYQIATGYRTFYSLSLIYQPITKKQLFFYKKVIEAVCKECGTDPVMMFSNNKERNVDARGVAITILADRKLSDNIISDLTGMTRQAVNRMRNLYPDRIRRSYFLRGVLESVKEKLAIENPLYS